MQIMNNKQIMYDCDKGYILTEKGPVGATCVGGLWRPMELPECLPALHPRLRWTRRRRRQTPQIKPVYSYNQFKRNLNVLLENNRALRDEIAAEQAITRQITLSNQLQQKRDAISEALVRLTKRMPHKRLLHINYNIPRTLRNNLSAANQQLHESNTGTNAPNRLPFELHGFRPKTNQTYAGYSEKLHRTKKTDIFFRAKRSMKEKDDDGSESDASKRAKAKEPCEVCIFHRLVREKRGITTFSMIREI